MSVEFVCEGEGQTLKVDRFIRVKDAAICNYANNSNKTSSSWTFRLIWGPIWPAKENKITFREKANGVQIWILVVKGQTAGWGHQDPQSSSHTMCMLCLLLLKKMRWKSIFFPRSKSFVRSTIAQIEHDDDTAEYAGIVAALVAGAAIRTCPKSSLLKKICQEFAYSCVLRSAMAIYL